MSIGCFNTPEWYVSRILKDDNKIVQLCMPISLIEKYYKFKF